MTNPLKPMTEREKLIEIMSHHHSGNIEEARKIADAILKYFTLKTHLREAVGALERYINQYDLVHHDVDKGETPRMIRQTLSKLKGVLDEENSVN